MPYLFLSPSTQEENQFVGGGSERYWTNQIADAMEPYLHASGINVIRNNPNGSANTAIRQSNLSGPDFHLALHTNAAPGETAGRARYSIVFYYPGSTEGQRMADILVKNLKKIYPLPDRVRAEARATIGELRLTRAPSAFIELGFHDNPEDAAWMTGNVDKIAQNLAASVSEYFGLPALQPREARTGTVSLSSGRLNLRGGPSTDAPILLTIPNGAQVQVLGEWNGWYTISYEGVYGYVRADFIRF